MCSSDLVIIILVGHREKPRVDEGLNFFVAWERLDGVFFDHSLDRYYTILSQRKIVFQSTASFSANCRYAFTLMLNSTPFHENNWQLTFAQAASIA